jgi:hypothetical protein
MNRLSSGRGGRRSRYEEQPFQLDAVFLQIYLGHLSKSAAVSLHREAAPLPQVVQQGLTGFAASRSYSAS